MGLEEKKGGASHKSGHLKGVWLEGLILAGLLWYSLGCGRLQANICTFGSCAQVN